MVTATRSAKARVDLSTATIVLNVFDGQRQPFTGTKILVRIRDGNQREQYSKFINTGQLKKVVPFFDNMGDNYAVLVSCSGYRDIGFYPVKVSPLLETAVDLML